jgi:hypothetical protein
MEVVELKGVVEVEIELVEVVEVMERVDASMVDLIDIVVLGGKIVVVDKIVEDKVLLLKIVGWLITMVIASPILLIRWIIVLLRRP